MEYIDKFLNVLRQFRTEEVILFFKDSQISELMHTPYFLGGVAVIALICLIMKWRLLLATLVGIVGFAELLAYTATQDNSLESGMSSNSLIVFIGGGIAIVSLVIYLLFIKSE